MKRLCGLRHIMLLGLCLLGGGAAYAQELRMLTPENSLIEEDSMGLTHLQSDGCNGFEAEEGAPELPVYRETFWGGEEARVELVSNEVIGEMEIRNGVYPVQPCMVKGREREYEPGYLWDESRWRRDYQPIGLKSIGRKGERVLWQIEIKPFEYDHATKTLKIHSIEYVFERDEGVGIKGEHCPRYEIVVPSQLTSAVGELVRWRQQCGYEVGVIESDGLEKEEIRSRLRLVSPDYVLIVGDLEEVASFSGRHNIAGLNSHYADLYFGEYTNDYIPEALVGRLPVSDTATLRRVVGQIIRYEQSPDALSVRRSMVVAGEESRTPAPTTTNGQVNYVGGRLGERTDTLCYRNPESEQLRDSILGSLHGRWGVVNYSSHCDVYGWKDPDVRISDLDTVEVALWVNNCCESNRFSGDCFGEELLKEGKGIAVIGAGNETLWAEDYFWSVGAKRPITLNPMVDSVHEGAFDKVVEGEIHTAGEMLMAGNLAVTESGSNYDAFYWEVYCLLGDPAMTLQIGMMDSLNLIVDEIEAGDVDLEVQGTPGAVVTLLQHDTLIGRAVIPASGRGEIALAMPLDTTQVILTATMPNKIPSIVDVFPTIPIGPRMVIRVENAAHRIAPGGEDTLWLVCRNVGRDTARMAKVILAQIGRDTLGANLTAGTEVMLGTVAPGEDTSIAIPFMIERTNSTVLSMHVGSSSQEGTIVRWQLVEWDVMQPRVETEVHLEQANRRGLWPNETVEISVTATNEGEQTAENYLIQVAITTYPDRAVVMKDTVITLEVEEEVTIRYEVALPNPLQGLMCVLRTEDTTYSSWWSVVRGKETFEAYWYYPWENNSFHGWNLDSTVSHSGSWSARSGNVEHGEHTDLRLAVEVEYQDTLGFWLKTSTEPDKDKLNFYLDNQRLFYWSGTRNWTYWKTIVPQGRHVLTWSYVKDGGNSEGDDCVWVDDIRLPQSRWDTLCGSMEIVFDSLELIENIEQQTLRIYPNPARDYVVIEAGEDTVVEMIDMMGRMVDRIELRNAHAAQYSTRHLRYGTYLVRCADKSGTTIHKLIITR